MIDADTAMEYAKMINRRLTQAIACYPMRLLRWLIRN
jgi:hypothetical protein